MFGLSRKRKIRRQRAKQLRVESSAPAWQQYTERIGLWPTLLTIVFFLITMVVSTLGQQALRYRVGEKIGHPIRARVDFSIPDPKQTDANIAAARESTPNHYTVNSEAIDRLVGELANVFQAAQADTYEKFQEEAAAAPWKSDKQIYDGLHCSGEPERESFAKHLEQLKAALASERTARLPSAEDRDPPSSAGHVVVRPAPGGGGLVEVPTLELIPMGNVAAIEGRVSELARRFDSPLRGAVRTIMKKAMSAEPMLVFDQKRTLAAMTAAESVTQPAFKHFEKDKPFVFPRYAEAASDDQAGAQKSETGLNPADIELLKTEEAAFQEFLDSGDPEAVRLRQQELYERIGIAVVLCALTIGLFVYSGLHQPRIFSNRSRSLAYIVLMIGTIAAVRLIDTRTSHPQFVLIPVLLAASILTITYPRRFAAGATVILSVIAVLVTRRDMGILITLIAGSNVTTLLLADIRTRTKIITAGVLTAIVVFITTFAFGLIGREEIVFVLTSASISAGSAVLAALIVQGVLPFIERIFKVATSLTLLEWRDANRKLLRRLAAEAPGTYNHSLVLGTIAEGACEAIGANGLLTHVGALYHDIGKISKAEYFAENQEASINRHDSLSPTMSLLIILGHVKDGLELAKEYGLPRILHQFIAEHHGTTVVRYFHHIASEQKSQTAKGKHDRTVSEEEFRYPGPKPASPETAILMLCDGVEGAVRALNEPTPGRIETTVHQILQARLKDGQFDDCDITLRELHRVEESLVKSLCRFYHGRVAYPKENKEAKEAPSATTDGAAGEKDENPASPKPAEEDSSGQSQEQVAQ